MLQRIGISLEEGLLRRFDGLIESKGYQNRSEAIRDLIRDALVQDAWNRAGEDEERVCVVVLVYDHESFALAQKLTHVQHRHYEQVVTTMHIHMDPHHCLEVLVLRGPGKDIVLVAESLVATRGVKFGKVILATTGKEVGE